MNKDWYKSKTIWLSVAGLISTVAVSMGYIEITPELTIPLVLGFVSLLGITLRDAVPSG